MSMYVNTNDNKRPRIEPGAAFFCIDYPVAGPVVARALALQNIVDRFTAVLGILSGHRIPTEQAGAAVEEVWLETVETVRRFDGASAGKTPSVKGTEAPTSAPSDDPSTPQASSSSTKRRAIQSASKPAASTTVLSAGGEQPSE